MSRRQGRTNCDWETALGSQFTWEQVGVEVLMDIRGELQRLNRLLQCPNFLRIPTTLRGIQRGTNRIPARKRKASKP